MEGVLGVTYFKSPSSKIHRASSTIVEGRVVLARLDQEHRGKQVGSHSPELFMLTSTLFNFTANTFKIECAFFPCW
jgi:hypothetical protein